jgi:hypothetical protein
MHVLKIKKLCIISFIANRKFLAEIHTVASTVSSLLRYTQWQAQEVPCWDTHSGKHSQSRCHLQQPNGMLISKTARRGGPIGTVAGMNQQAWREKRLGREGGGSLLAIRLSSVKSCLTHQDKAGCALRFQIRQFSLKSIKPRRLIHLFILRQIHGLFQSELST